MGTTHLEHALEFFRLLEEGIDQIFNSLEQHVATQEEHQVKSRRVRVVRGLTEVGMIVRGNALGVALNRAELFTCQVANHFVDVHVRRSASTTLQPVGHKLILILASDQFIAGPDESVSDISRDRAEFLVGQSGSLLHIRISDQEERFHVVRHFRDMEVFLATERLNAIVAIIGNFELTKEVTFKARHLNLLLNLSSCSRPICREFDRSRNFSTFSVPCPFEHVV